MVLGDPELAPKPQQLIIFGEKKESVEIEIRENLYPLNSNNNDIALQVKEPKLRGLKTAEAPLNEAWRKETVGRRYVPYKAQNLINSTIKTFKRISCGFSSIISCANSNISAAKTAS